MRHHTTQPTWRQLPQQQQRGFVFGFGCGCCDTDPCSCSATNFNFDLSGLSSLSVPTCVTAADWTGGDECDSKNAPRCLTWAGILTGTCCYWVNADDDYENCFNCLWRDIFLLPMADGVALCFGTLAGIAFDCEDSIFSIGTPAALHAYYLYEGSFVCREGGEMEFTLAWSKTTGNRCNGWPGSLTLTATLSACGLTGVSHPC